MKTQGFQERKDIVRKFSKYFICLNSGHRATNCRAKVNCRICGGRHRVSACTSSNRNEKLSATPAAPNATYSAAQNATLDPNATSWAGSTISGNKIALQTA